MSDKTSNPFGEWRRKHPHSSFSVEQNRNIDQWVHISIMMLDMFDEFEDVIEPWLKGNNGDAPDFVKFISQYGYILEVTGNWTELPINIPTDEIEQWDKNSALVVTMEQLEDWRAAISGSIIEMLQINLTLTTQKIKEQLHERYASLAEMSLRPVRAYAPTQWTYHESLEEWAMEEVAKLDAIFEKYEELYCFEQAIEMLRMIVITEDNPDFDLPNKSFYDALVSIDSQTLMEALHLAEPKLKEILKLWSSTVMEYNGLPFYQEDENAPDNFWWRHWKVSGGQRPKNKRPNGHGKSSHK